MLVVFAVRGCEELFRDHVCSRSRQFRKKAAIFLSQEVVSNNKLLKTIKIWMSHENGFISDFKASQPYKIWSTPVQEILMSIKNLFAGHSPNPTAHVRGISKVVILIMNRINMSRQKHRVIIIPRELSSMADISLFFFFFFISL